MLSFFSKIYNSEKTILIIIFFLSCFFSIIFLSFFKNIGPAGHRIPGTDYSNCYAPMAENIIQGKGIVVNKEYIRCAAGYPLVLIPIFYIANTAGLDKISVIIFFNVIFTALASLILFLIAENIFNKNIAMLASFLWMSYPFNQWLIKNPNTEVPFITLLLLGLFLYIYFFSETGKKSYLFFAGIILGLASLIRPIGILIPLILAILIFFIFKGFSIKNKIILFLMIILGNLIVIMPWELYVLSKTANLALISDAGPEGVRVGFSFGANPGEGGQQFKAPQDVIDFMKILNSAEVANHGSYKEIFILLKKEIIRSPIAFVKIIFIKIARSWYATSEMWLENKILLVQIPYLAMAVLGIIFSIKFYRSKISYIIALLSIIGYFWFITTMTLSIIRYIIPAMALVLIFTALAIDKLILNNLVKNG